MGNPNPLQNLNLNPKQNIQMIFVEPREANIVVITRGGVASGADQNAQHDQPQVGPTTQKKVSFDVRREK